MSLTVNNKNPYLVEMFRQTLCNHAQIGNVHHIFELLRNPQIVPSLQALKERVLTQINHFSQSDIKCVKRAGLFGTINSSFPSFHSEEESSQSQKKGGLDAKKDQAWQSLDVRRIVFSFLTPKEIINFGVVDRYLQSVNFEDVCFHLQKACSSTLNVICSFARAFHIRNIYEVVHIFPQLAGKTKELSLYNSGINDAGLAGFPNMPELTSIDLVTCTQITNTMEGFGQLPSKFPNLKELGLRGTAINDQVISWLVPQLPSLTAVNLNECTNIADAAVVALSKLPNLERLWLRSCKISTVGLNSIANNCSRLTELNLSIAYEFRQYVSDSFVSDLAKKCPKLTALTLNQCNITDAALKALGENCEKLQVLYLNSTSITDEGIFCVVDHCKELTHIDIRVCSKVTKIGIAYLRNSPKLKIITADFDLKPTSAVVFAKYKPDINAGPEHVRYKNEFAYKPKTSAGEEYRNSLEELVKILISFSAKSSFMEKISEAVAEAKMFAIDHTITRGLSDLSENNKLLFNKIWIENCGNLKPQDHLTRTADTLYTLETMTSMSKNN